MEKTSDYMEIAKDLIDDASHNFGAVATVTWENGKSFHIRLKADQPNVYELKIETGNFLYNNCKLVGKIYDIINADELANTIEELDKGIAIVSTKHGRMTIGRAIEKSKEIEREG